MKERIRSRNLLVKIGMWAWGTATASLAFFALATLALAAGYLDYEGGFVPGTPQYVAGLYFVLKDCGAAVGGIVGFSGLAWAHFFTAKPETD